MQIFHKQSTTFDSRNSTTAAVSANSCANDSFVCLTLQQIQKARADDGGRRTNGRTGTVVLTLVSVFLLHFSQFFRLLFESINFCCMVL